MGYALEAIPTLDDSPASVSLEAMLLGLGLAVDPERFVGLGRRVVEQTERRVFWHEKVAASDKIVSIFEPHTDASRGWREGGCRRWPLEQRRKGGVPDGGAEGVLGR
jgi:hypothetical protein